jgi:hypothetical protein
MDTSAAISYYLPYLIIINRRVWVFEFVVCRWGTMLSIARAAALSV